MATITQTRSIADLIGRAKIARAAFYLGAAVLAVALWKLEVHIQSAPGVYGAELDSLSQLQQSQLAAFLEMNRLITTLGTTLLGAMGFLVANNRPADAQRTELWAAFGSAVCVSLSLYFGYHAYEDIILMLQNNTFDLTSPIISWDRQGHFIMFLLGVFFFADFAFHELNRKAGAAPS